ncbi:MAG: hypothetical protein M1820_009544 [Bogoriella megaspora]|nr:MAG: hypothetical protein M1820_009544 [Bogoriella megaspora]
MYVKSSKRLDQDLPTSQALPESETSSSGWEGNGTGLDSRNRIREMGMEEQWTYDGALEEMEREWDGGLGNPARPDGRRKFGRTCRFSGGAATPRPRFDVTSLAGADIALECQFLNHLQLLIVRPTSAIWLLIQLASQLEFPMSQPGALSSRTSDRTSCLGGAFFPKGARDPHL